NRFKPLGITAPLNGTDLISVTYRDSDVTTITDTSQRVASLPAISNCEYWDVKQLNGNSDVTISPSWNDPCLDNSVYFTDPQNLRIARWNGNTWQDGGNGGFVNGIVSTANPLPANGLFTFASPKRVVIIPEPPEPSTMIVYPNPASQYLNIVVDSGYKQGMLIDAIGRTLSIHSIQAGLNAIDVSRLPSGVYFLKLITARKQFVTKWIKL